MITFQIKPHKIAQNIEVVEIRDGNQLLGVIYPGNGQVREAKAIRIESRHFFGNVNGPESKVVRFK